MNACEAAEIFKMPRGRGKTLTRIADETAREAEAACLTSGRECIRYRGAES